MNLDPKQMQAISELAAQLYEFLPGKPYPYANQNIFQGCAYNVGIGHFWEGGSKKTAIAKLLENTLSKSRDRFCPLILEKVNTFLLQI